MKKSSIFAIFAFTIALAGAFSTKAGALTSNVDFSTIAPGGSCQQTLYTHCGAIGKICTDNVNNYYRLNSGCATPLTMPIQ